MDLMLTILSVVLSSFSANSSRVVGTDASLRSLKTVVSQFRQACGRLPTEREGLDVLVQKPVDWPNTIRWTPFLDWSEVPHDGWGNHFVYLLMPESPDGFGIYSCGQDGVTSSMGNDEDDLNTWDTRRSWYTYYRHQAWKAHGRSRAIALAIIVLIVAAAVGVLWRATRTGTPSRS